MNTKYSLSTMISLTPLARRLRVIQLPEQGIKTIGDLLKLTDHEISSLKGVGIAAQNEITCLRDLYSQLLKMPGSNPSTTLIYFNLITKVTGPNGKPEETGLEVLFDWHLPYLPCRGDVIGRIEDLGARIPDELKNDREFLFTKYEVTRVCFGLGGEAIIEIHARYF